MLDVKLFEHVLEIPIERAKTLNQRTLIMVLGLTNEHAYFELVDSNPIRYFNSPIMDISIPFHHDPTKLHALGVCCCTRASSFSSKSCFGTSWLVSPEFLKIYPQSPEIAESPQICSEFLEVTVAMVFGSSFETSWSSISCGLISPIASFCCHHINALTKTRDSINSTI